MSVRWRLGDLIDFEYFLEQEETTGDVNVEKDRNMYLEYKNEEGNEKSDSLIFRQGLFKTWLENRRNGYRQVIDEEAASPGEIFEEVYHIFIFVFLFVGFFLGAGAAFQVLSYDGLKPVNVTLYVAFFVLCQILLVAVILVFSLFRVRNVGYSKPSITYRAVANLLMKTIHFINEKTIKKLNQETRNELEGAIGLVKGKHSVYGHIFYWPVFNLVQLGSIGFNAGVIGSTLIRVFGQDLAFGWESTIQFSSQTIFNFVKTLATPWSWFLPQGFSYPTLAEIEGSKIVLKNGIYHLLTQDLVSWWPFLCLSVIFYGLIPRVILFLVGKYKERKALNGIGFDTAACEKVMIRMKTPGLETRGKDEVFETREIGNETIHVIDDKGVDTDESAIVLDKDISGARVLIPTDIFEDVSENQLKEVLMEKLGVGLIEKIETGLDPETDSRMIGVMSVDMNKGAKSEIVILQEAWQPPIQETRMFLEEIRKAVGKNIKIVILLLGKPKAGQTFTPVIEQDQRMWDSFISKMGDPYLWVLSV